MRREDQIRDHDLLQLVGAAGGREGAARGDLKEVRTTKTRDKQNGEALCVVVDSFDLLYTRLTTIPEI